MQNKEIRLLHFIKKTINGPVGTDILLSIIFLFINRPLIVSRMSFGTYNNGWTMY